MNLTEVRMVRKDELYHYGVKGMKWGVRRRSEAVKTARSNYKAANKEYKKAYNKAHNYSSRHPVSQFVGKKKKAEADIRWDDAINKADKANKAKAAYKQAKKDYDKTPEGQAVAANRKKAIKVGAAAAATALAVYGTKKFIDTKSQNIVLEKGKAEAQKFLNDNRVKSMVIDGNKVSITRGDGLQVSTSTYRDASKEAIERAASMEKNLYNKVALRDSKKIYDDAKKAASNMNFKEKSKTVYDYYRKRKK